ncbi:PleD family two-component system response regulator [Pedobacter cryoconitis]|uniref:DNA-binding response OmpR family regulator n=1 Tax=Pedobacter cryoconitis TaxID=188932 RepID=A0A7X0J2I5_9SPHI|nr:response regulator [Pedobacter cryoconitis]MBB6498582.1 DNA-binding response OmpR family regulator [Pedobacter cryoconitis]
MNKKIIIFDDDPEVLTALESALDFADWDLITFSSGRNAMQKIQQESPDLILMDIQLDGFDGREICRSVKENTVLQHIPVILISGMENAEIPGHQDFGPNDFLPKPFNIGDLIDKVYFQLAY